jgi:hypothetical protein
MCASFTVGGPGRHEVSMGMLTRKRPPAVLFAVMGAVVVFGFAYAAWKVWNNDRALETRGEQTTARVVEIGTGKHQRIEVEFRTADGRTVRTLIGQGDEPPGAPPVVGEEITIVYDPRAPESEVADTRAPQNHQTAYLLIGAAVFGAVGVPLATIALVRRNRRGD